MRDTNGPTIVRSIVVAVALVLAAAVPAAATHGQPDKVVPFMGSVSMDSESYAAPSCPGGAWDYSTAGVGTMTHLGRVTFEQAHCTHFDGATGLGWVDDSQMTIIAANGDALHLLADATFVYVEPISTITFTWRVVDGSGRFEGATGSGTGRGLGDVSLGVSTDWFWGAISYDAAN